MQILSYHLITGMTTRVTATAVTWGGSQKLLPAFFLWALARSVWAAVRGVDLVHIGDPVMAPIGWLIKRLFNVPVVVTVHGLDITYPSRLYQWFVPRVLQGLDCLVCISESARRVCVERGLSAERCETITPGVAVPAAVLPGHVAREWLETRVGRDLQGAQVLLTVGRLVPRKGVAWFVASVLPAILSTRRNICYVIVGGGPDEQRVRALTSDPRLEGCVHVLGQVPERDRDRAYAAADLFVMPNLPVPGDMEGFGLVALEAAAHSLPVLAADLEGIRDAVVPGKIGWLLPAGDSNAWVQGVLGILDDPLRLSSVSRRARSTVQEQFTWTRMADAYEALFRQVVLEYDL